jgi:hypothetical protein
MLEESQKWSKPDVDPRTYGTMMNISFFFFCGGGQY